jgi:hypothetical protein
MSEKSADGPTPSQSDNGERKRSTSRSDRARIPHREALIGGIALVIGAALGLLGSVYVAQSQVRTEHNDNIRQACAAYSAALITWSNEAINLLGSALSNDGYTQQKANTITMRLETAGVPIFTNLSNALLLINSTKAENIATRGLDDYGYALEDMQAGTTFDSDTARAAINQVIRDGYAFTQACRADLGESSLPTPSE